MDGTTKYASLTRYQTDAHLVYNLLPSLGGCELRILRGD